MSVNSISKSNNKETYNLDSINVKDDSIKYQVEYKIEKYSVKFKLEDLKMSLTKMPRWLVVAGSLILLFLVLMLIILLAFLLKIQREGILNEDCSYRKCSSSLNLKCINKTCQCESKQYYTNKCYNLSLYQDDCVLTEHCETNKSLVCLYSKCSCINSKFWDTNNQYCVDRLNYGEKCSIDQCKLDSNLTCNLNSGLCDCDQSSIEYWNGTNCVKKKEYNQMCENDLQCLGSELTTCINSKCSCGNNKYFDKYTSKCEYQFSELEKCNSSIECLSPMFCSTKLLCSCPLYQFHDSNTFNCVYQYTNGQLCNTSSQCRDDLGLECYNNICSCIIQEQIWCSQLQKCVYNNGLNLATCSNDCTCRDDLGLSCQSYSNEYECYDSFSSKKCLCNSTNYWDGNLCVNKLSENSVCTNNCSCRQDLGLYCQTFSNDYNSYTTYSGYLCKCLPTHYWSDYSCVSRLIEQQTCSSNLECRMDLGLSCKLYSSIGYSCYSSFNGKKCLCDDNYYWNGSKCQKKKLNDIPCSNNCECRKDLGLICQENNVNNVCKCNQTTEYWNGTNCVKKKEYNQSCENDLQCLGSELTTCINSKCSCGNNKYFEENQSRCIKYPRDCYDLYLNGQTSDGIYTIYLSSSLRPVQVYCEMKKGGWTRIFNKIDTSGGFDKFYAEYENGFGSSSSSFNTNNWFGLANMYDLLISNNYTLLIEFSDPDFYYIQYDNFKIGTALERFPLNLGSLIGRNSPKISDFSLLNGQTFKAKGNDPTSCTSEYKGGWWYKQCFVNSICVTCSFFQTHIPDIQFSNIKMLVKPNV